MLNGPDTRLTAIYNRQKKRFERSEDHELLGTPYPEDDPAPIWKANLATRAGDCHILTGQIRINPNYALAFSKQLDLEEIILHEMLHRYVCAVHGYFGGHKGPWKAIADAWDLTVYHHLEAGYHEHTERPTSLTRVIATPPKFKKRTNRRLP